MKKFMISVLSAICMALFLMPAAVRAADGNTGAETAGKTIVASGVCGAEGGGGNLTWKLDSEGCLTISGTGKMANWAQFKAPWYEICSSVISVNIEAGVTSIGGSAFCSCSSLTEISIPEGVTSIGGALSNGAGA